MTYPRPQPGIGNQLGLIGLGRFWPLNPENNPVPLFKNCLSIPHLEKPGPTLAKNLNLKTQMGNLSRMGLLNRSKACPFLPFSQTEE